MNFYRDVINFGVITRRVLLECDFEWVGLHPPLFFVLRQDFFKLGIINYRAI